MVNRGQLVASIENKNLEQFKQIQEEAQEDASKKKTKVDQKNDFKIGDTVKVWVKIKEGQGKKERIRLQGFEGIVISIKGESIAKNFTVRKVSFGIGIERIFPYNSPLIDRVEITREGKVRRAKLYYLRKRIGKAAQVKRKEYKGTKKVKK